MNFNKQYSFEQRKRESGIIAEKYQNRVPVIVEKNARSGVKNIDRSKFLVPSDLTVGQFAYIIRKRIELRPEEALFVFINDTLPSISSTMADLYKECKNADGFLYVTYSGENFFG